MKRKWKSLLMATVLSTGFLAGCTLNDEPDDNRNNDNNEENGPEDVNYQPEKEYDHDTNTNEIDEDNIRDKEPGTHDEDPQETDMELQKGNDRQFDKNRGPQ